MTCQLVCSGWYSNEEIRPYQVFGDDFIRSRDFRPLWWKSLEGYVNPEHVLIVDSNSPIKPNDTSYTSKRIENLNLLINPGHSQTGKVFYCGAMAAIISGMEYALFNDVDYFLYVEQDALIYGDDFVKKIENTLLKSDLVFGNGGTYLNIEQTVFAVNKRSLRKFLSAVHAIKYSDKQIEPEFKFMYAASKIRNLPLIGLTSWDHKKIIRRPAVKVLHWIISLLKEYDVLPFGYGRVRPINFSDETFFFQQGTSAEIKKYRELTGF